MIRLAMLTYNEAHNLPAIAEQLQFMVDDVVIVDDVKSDDGTEDLAYSLWPGHCKVIKSSLTSFADERNKLLALAREGLDPSSYIMIMDPDDRPSGSIPKLLTDPMYFCKYVSGTQEWLMPLLLRADFLCYYEGTAHELLRTGDTPAILLPDFIMNRFSDGASEERKLWTVELLEKEPDNPRSVFYLARTYQSLGRLPEALSCYMRRSNMPSPDTSETYYATYCAAALATTIDPGTAELFCRRAMQLSPTHKEPYYVLANLYNHLGQHDLALETANLGIKLPPCSDVMFVDRWMEAIGLYIEAHTATELLERSA